MTIKARNLDLHHSQSKYKPVVKNYISTNHYSGTCPGGMHTFHATYRDEIVGGMLFRKPSLPKTRMAYGVDIELSRLVMSDCAGKNSESRFIGYALRWLKKNTDLQSVISFADPRFGHSGVIYKAANFEVLGKEKGHGTRRIVVNGEWIHSKTAYDRWGMSGAALKEHLAPAVVEIVVCPPKNVYRYNLK